MLQPERKKQPWQGHSVLLVAFKGMPGSGKSTLARTLSKQLGWPLIDKDDIKDIIDGHSDDSGGLAYTVMFNIARRQLLQGLNTICDSPLTYEFLYRQAQALANDTRARLLVLECVCWDEEEWKRRVDARGELALPSHHMTSWEKLQGYRAIVEGKTEYVIEEPHLVVDTGRPVEEVVGEVLTWILELSGS